MSVYFLLSDVMLRKEMAATRETKVSLRSWAEILEEKDIGKKSSPMGGESSPGDESPCNTNMLAMKKQDQFPTYESIKNHWLHIEVNLMS
jgi:hypothetical protein